jgi:hypothetical protein
MRGSSELNELYFFNSCYHGMWAALDARFADAAEDGAEERAHKAKARAALKEDKLREGFTFPEASLDAHEVTAKEWPFKAADFAGLREAFTALSDAFQTLQRQVCDAFGASVISQLRKRAEREEGEVSEDDADADAVARPAKRAAQYSV